MPWNFHLHHSPCNIISISSHHMPIPSQSSFLHIQDYISRLRCSFYQLISDYILFCDSLHIHRNILISATVIFFTVPSLSLHVSLPYIIAGRTAAFYKIISATFPFSSTFILLSQSTPDSFRHAFHPHWIRWLISTLSSQSSLTCVPWYLKACTFLMICSTIFMSSRCFYLVFHTQHKQETKHMLSFMVLYRCNIVSFYICAETK